MATDLSPILESARKILRDAGRKGMHVRDIAEAAAAQNENMGLSVEVFCKKVQAALLGNLKLKSAKPTFAPVKWEQGARKGKPKQGWYRLKTERITPVSETVCVPQTSRAFIGKAGEFAVMSELLFWGFNASIMTVDDGIDIVASKENKFFHIQVKTATCQENGKHLFTINHASFKKYNTTNVFYVLVMRNSMKNEYIIIPSGQINYFVNSNIITGTSALSLIITANSNLSEYTLNGKANITPFYGDFGAIIA